MVPNVVLTVAMALGACGQVLPPQPQPMPPDDFPPGDRYADVLAAPPLSDLYRFPPKTASNRARYINGNFRYYLTQERAAWPESVQYRFELAHVEAMRAYAIWDKLDDAQAEWKPWWKRRLHLAELKSLMGAEAYARGEMPEPLPSHLFRELK